MPPEFVFEPNRGQADGKIRYLGRGGGTVVAFKDNSVGFRRSSAAPLELKFPGRNQAAKWEPLDALPSTTSYYLGSDPTRWIAGLPHSRRIIQRDAYPGIDIIFYGQDGRLEFDFVLSRHADARRIRLAWSAAVRGSITAAGDLALADGTGRLVCAKPAVYQETKHGRVSIEGRFIAERDEARFELGPYNHDLPLTIDPVIDAASYVGGEGADRITASDGSVHAGVTESASLWIYTPRQGRDVFVLSGSGSVSIYGGSGDEEPTSVAGVLVGGWTSSEDFPTVASAAQPVFGGGSTDGFVIRIGNYPGEGATYLGGAGDDRVLAITLSSGVMPSNGGGYVAAGETTSRDFPVRNAVQPAAGGGKDGFLTRYNSVGQIVDSTYYGGSGDESILALAVKAATLWFGGRTTSTDLPLQVPLQQRPGGGAEAFVGRLDTTTTPAALGFSTYYGGSGDDEIRSLQIAPDGWIWVAGNTTSTDLPVLRASQDRLAGGLDAWIARLHPRRPEMSFATYFGGTGRDELTSAGLDANGELYIAGFTDSVDLWVRDALQDGNGGADDGFFARLDVDGLPRMVTYLGGTGNDRIFAIATLTPGSVAIAGESDSPEIPALRGKTGTSAPMGGADGWIVKLHHDGIYAANVVVGKDLVATAPFTAVLDGAAAPLLTVRSTDPSKALVNGAAFSTAEKFDIAGLASQGEVELVVSAPGLDPRRVKAVLRPSFLLNTLEPRLHLDLDGTIWVTPQFGTKHSETGDLVIQTLRPNVTAGAELRSADSNIVRVQNLTMRGARNGSTTVSLMSPLFPIEGPREMEVTVGPPRAPVVRIRDTAVGRQLRTKLTIETSGLATPQFTVRLTSEDPSKLLLAATATSAASESVSAQSNGETAFIWIEGVGESGIARVRAEVDGAEPVFANIALAPSIAVISLPSETPTYFWNNNAPIVHNPNLTSATVESWSTTAVLGLVLAIDGAPPAGFVVGPQIPAHPARFNVVSSDESILSSLRSYSFPLSDNPVPAGLFNPKTGKAGTASLTLESDTYKTAPPVSITVLPRTLPLDRNEIWLGKDLQIPLGFRIVGGFPNDTQIVITSGDPSRVLVSLYGDEASSATRTGLGQFFISALADSGDVPVIFKAPGFVDTTLTVHLAPTRFGLSSRRVTAESGDSVPLAITWDFPGKPAGYSPITVRQNRPYTFSVEPSDPGVIRKNRDVLTFYSVAFVEMTAVNEGVCDVRLISMSGAIIDPDRAVATVTVTPRKFRFFSSGMSLGKDLQTLLPASGNSSTTPTQSPVTLRSLDPSKLLLSVDPLVRGTENVPGSRQVWAQALADSGEVYVVASAAGYYDTLLKVRLYPAAIGFETSLGGAGDPVMASPGGNVDLRIVPYLVEPASGNISRATNYSLRGGLEPFEVRLRSTNPAAGRINSPIGFMGGMSDNTAVFRAEASGSTDLEAEPPSGFTDVTSLTRRRIEVGKPRLRFCRESIALGKDMQAGICAQTSAPSSDSRLPVTFTSADPARLLVSATADKPGSVSATVFGSGAYVYVQALAASGDVEVTAAAPGYEAGSAVVRLEPSFFAFNRDFFPAPRYQETLQVNSLYRLQIYIAHPSDGDTSSKSLRAGLDPIDIPVESSNPSVLSMKQPVRFLPAKDSAIAEFTVAAPGSTELRVGAPARFALAPARDRTITVQSQMRKFDLRNLSVGKDRAAAVSFSYSLPDIQTAIRVVSSDPTRVLLARDLKSAGGAELTFNVGPGSSAQPSFYVYGMAASGSATISLSGPGYEPQTVAVELLPSGFWFSAYNTSTNVRADQSTQVRISAGEPLRGGIARVPVDIENSNPAAVALSPVSFGPGETYQEFSVIAKAPGIAILTIRNAGLTAGSSAVFVVNVVP